MFAALARVRVPRLPALLVLALAGAQTAGCHGPALVPPHDSGTVDGGGLDGAMPDANVEDGGAWDGAATDGGPADDAPAAPPVPGLALHEQYELPIPSGHLGEVTIRGNVAYIANSWDSFTTMALEPDGSIFATLARPEETPRPRCTTLATHDASSTLYCSSDESDRVTAYDLTDPEHAVLRATGELVLSARGVRDLEVVRNTLYLAQFDRGLWTSRIGPAGELSPAVPTSVTGNVRFVSADAARLVALSADRGLLVLSGTGAGVTVRDELALPGTPQDLSVRGDRAAVALGSAGAMVVDLSGAPTVTARVQPQAVVTGADLDGDSLALTTLTGVYLYNLATTPPRLVGYSASGRRADRSGGVMLSGRFAGTDFITSDWIFVERFSTDRAGHVLEVDMPRGIYLRPGFEATIAFRNEGDLPFDLSLRVGTTFITSRVDAEATAAVTLDAAMLAPLDADPRPVIDVTFTSAAGTSGVELPVAFRPASPLPPRERPAAGDRFPEIRVVAPTDVVSIPVAGRRSLVVFFARDCAAMWPVLEDSTYLGAAGLLDDGAIPFLLTESDAERDGYAARWGLGAADIGNHGYLAPPDVIAFNGSETVFEDRFQISNLPRAASHPTDYLIDTAGVVEAVDTYYRGAFPLR